MTGTPPAVRRTALITGASSGIGEAFARKLAARGYDLELVARRSDRLEALKKELESDHSISTEYLATDLATDSGIELVENRIAGIDNLEMLINNAGFGTTGLFAEIEPGKHNAMVNVHVAATTRLCRAALPAMLERGSGAIINVSSVAGMMPAAGGSIYAATKAFIIYLSESIDAEVRREGVIVQALCPGFTYTEFHDTEEYEKFERSMVPKHFWMSAEEVVEKSLAALGRRRKTVFVPGLSNRIVAALTRTPLAPLIRRQIEKARRRMREGK